MKICILLFDYFETLDVFGPVEICGRLPEHFTMDYYSLGGGLKTSTQGVSIPTRKLPSADTDFDLLFVPGGKGTRTEIDNNELIVMLKKLAIQSKYTLTVCTGSALLAATGLLDGKIATSNKRAFDWVKSTRRQVQWKGKARWTADGKFYTSSGISAGMDMALGFVRDILGGECAERIAAEMEYQWNPDPDDDPFAK